MNEPDYTGRDVVLRSQLEHLCNRPEMYFGVTPTVSVELASFLNGWMGHRGGFYRGGFGMRCRADPDKTPRENGLIFLEQILEWEQSKPGKWRCCIDGRSED